MAFPLVVSENSPSPAFSPAVGNVRLKKIKKQISSRIDSETKKKDRNDVRNEKEDKKADLEQIKHNKKIL